MTEESGDRHLQQLARGNSERLAKSSSASTDGCLAQKPNSAVVKSHRLSSREWSAIPVAAILSKVASEQVQKARTIAKTLLEQPVNNNLGTSTYASSQSSNTLSRQQDSRSGSGPASGAPPLRGNTAKTLLDYPIGNNTDTPGSTENALSGTQTWQDIRAHEPSPPPAEQAKIDDSPQKPAAPEMPPPPPAALKRKGKPKEAKTMLDHAVLWDTVAKAAAEMEVKVAEQLKERVYEPVKPFEPITKYKKASPCCSIWENTSPGERFRYCGTCQLHVYDLSGLELQQAEELIRKRENLSKITLYKRADGKFLTRDCPVGLKKRRNIIFASVGGCLLVALVLAALLMMPQAPKSAVQPQAGSQFTQSGADSFKTADQSRQPTAQPAPAPPTTARKSSTPTPTRSNTITGSTSSGSDDYSDYWQFPDGKGGTTGEESTTAGSQSQAYPSAAQSQPQPDAANSNSGATQSAGQSSSTGSDAPLVHYYGRAR